MVGEQERDFDLALDATILASLRRSQGSLASPLPLHFSPSDLRKKIYQRPSRTLVIFVVDSSDSMGDDGTCARIRAAKGAVLAMLGRAYQKRHRVGMVVFREEAAQVVLPPTTSLTLAERRLQSIPTGGATPFADGLMKAWQVLRNERRKDPTSRSLLVVLSDGEANVPYDPERKGSEVFSELLEIAGRIGKESVASLAIDTRPLREPAMEMRQLAAALGADYRHISQLAGNAMLRAVAEL